MYRYYDIRVEDKTGRTFYLRYKVERRTGFTVITVRTQRKGKGNSVVRVQGMPMDSPDGVDNLLARLCRKWKREFYIVTLNRCLLGYIEDRKIGG